MLKMFVELGKVSDQFLFPSAHINLPDYGPIWELLFQPSILSTGRHVVLSIHMVRRGQINFVRRAGIFGSL
jgi:hypothetical protein